MKYFAVVFAFLIATLTFAQSTGEIAGVVLDKEGKRPLSGANVSILNTTRGAVTDAEGQFSMSDLLPGTYEIQASFVGFRKAVLNVTVRGREKRAVEFFLSSTTIPIQPITVAATRGRERETPVTFSTLHEQDIRDRYTTQDIPVLLSELPSITTYSEGGNGIGYTYMNIRGFDSRRIAVMVNGIPQNDPEDHNVYWLDMPDLAASVDDIQVQRGAGSAFYGPPAIGGSVNVLTSSFGRERSIKLSTGTGSYNTRKYSASFTSGLIGERYALHGRLAKVLSDGYRDRAWVDFNSYFLGVARYDENMTTQFHFYGGPISDGLAYFGIPKADVKDRAKRRANPITRDQEIENFSQPHYELFHEWNISDNFTLNNALFYVQGDGFFDYDGSWAPYSYYRITPQNGFNVVGDPDTLYLPGALIRAFVGNRQVGWLPRATIKHTGGELTVGAELRIHRSEHWGRLQWTQGLPADVPWDYRYYQYRGAKDIISIYLSELYRLNSSMTVLANLQYAYNKYRLYDEKFVGNDFSVPYHFVNPRIGLNFNIDDKWNTYISLAYTRREPRLKNLYDAAEASTPASWGAVVPQFETDGSGRFDPGKPLVKPEALFNVELGGGYASEAASISANVYWMEFTNEIIKSGQVDRFGQPITGNADRTRHIGVELSGKAALSKNVEVSGNTTLSRNRFIRHIDYSTGSPLRLDRNPIAGFPDVLANARMTFRKDDFAISVSGRYVGKQHTDNFKNEANTVDPFFVSDMWTSYGIKNLFGGVGLETKLQVNNIFDTLYAAYGEGKQFFVGAERNFFFSLMLSL